jgi:oligopeptidase B
MLHGKIIIAGYIKKNILEVLRDKNKLLPEVKDYLEEENKYTDHHLENTKAYSKKII